MTADRSMWAVNKTLAHISNSIQMKTGGHVTYITHCGVSLRQHISSGHIYY